MSGFVYTTAIRKIRAMKARKRVVQGGSSAGKTYGIIPILIDYAAKNRGSEISVVSESIPHLRRGAMKDFIKIMQATGRFNAARWNRTLLTYTFANGSYIEFFSATDESRLRGARRTTLYVNEANNITFEEYHQLAIRTSGDIYLDFNPTSEFWAHTEVLKEPDSELLILTYEDNEGLPANVRQDMDNAIEKAKTSDWWANWVRVYVRGQIGSLQGVIFNNWKHVSEVPTEAKLLGIGLDFGFTNDPTAAVAVYQHDGRYIVDELIYETGLLNTDIAERLKQYNCTIIADSAEPKSIEELRRSGLRIKGATKGTDSVRFGIQLMQEQEWFVTENSTNVTKELRVYSWETDKTGRQTGNPIGTMNHSIDAWRYWALDNLHKSFTGTYSFA